MKDDIPAAAFRLACALGARTHERTFVNHLQGSTAPPPIIINNRKYASIMDASRKLKTDRNMIRRMLRKGKASYA